MRKCIVLAAAILIGGILIAKATAQSRGGAGSGVDIPPSMAAQTNTSANQVAIFGNYQDQTKRLSNDDKEKGKTLADLMAQDKAEVGAVMQSTHFSCAATSAVLVSAGPIKGDVGVAIDTKTYEVSCDNGMGYFITVPAAGEPSGISCFGMSAASAKDVAAGKKAGALCGLPANRDLKAMAAALVQTAGKACEVRNWRWMGHSEKSNTDYSEVACSDAGYVIAAPLPGSKMKPIVVGCHESYVQGIACKLSDNGPPMMTMKTLLDAIAQQHVACAVTDSRLVGKETVKQRRVVELKCSDRPGGVVAYVPLEGNSTAFEAVDCSIAAQRGVSCTLSRPK